MGAKLQAMIDGEFMIRMFGAESVETDPSDYRAWLPRAEELNRYVRDNVVEISDVDGRGIARTVRFRILQAGHNLRLTALRSRVEEAEAVIEESDATFARAGQAPDRNDAQPRKRIDRQLRKLIIAHAIAVADDRKEDFLQMHRCELAAMGEDQMQSFMGLEGPADLLDMIGKARLLEMDRDEVRLAN